MKKYVIICETMNRTERLSKDAFYSLGELIKSSELYPIPTIELKDGITLYFVSTYYWYDRGGCLGRHDWKPLGENYFRGCWINGRRVGDEKIRDNS